MNEHSLKNRWSDIKNLIQEKWPVLNDEELDQISASKDKLLNRLQELYGYTKEEAQAEWNEFSQKAKHLLREMGGEASSFVGCAKEGISGFVEHSPMKALGIAALIGLIVGLRF